MTLTPEKRYELGVQAHNRLKKSGDRHTNALYTTVKSNGKGTKYTRICHSGLQVCNEGAVVICNSIQYNSTYGNHGRKFNKEAATEWYDYLFNRSAWADTFLSKDPDVDRLIKEGVQSRTDKSANQVAAGCIHVRATWEKPYILDTFFELRDMGVEEDRAFLLSFAVKWDVRTRRWYSQLQYGHCGVWPTSMDSTALKNYLSKTVPNNGNSRNSKTYEELGGYMGAPFMWNDKYPNIPGENVRQEGSLGGKLLDKILPNAYRDNTLTIDPFNVLPELTKTTQNEKEKSMLERINNAFEELV